MGKTDNLVTMMDYNKKKTGESNLTLYSLPKNRYGITDVIQTEPNIMLSEFVKRFQLQLPPSSPKAKNQRQAAVLIPIISRAEPTLLLTQRSPHLRQHSGQVAFPGGRADLEDQTLIDTALREAEEEIALPKKSVNVIGQLPSIDSITGYNVTPIVGIVSPDVHFLANAAEVSDLFEMPLTEAMCLSRYHTLNVRHHKIYLSWYQNRFIWGLTAAIIYRLAQQTTHFAFPPG